MDIRKAIVYGDPTLHTVRRTSAECCGYMACFFFAALCFFAGCKREVIVPVHLTGEWKTAAPGYADRFMKFTKDTLVYGIGNGEEIPHRIKHIDTKQLGQKVLYTFYYKDAADDNAHLSFTYTSDSGGTIQLKNDNKIWKKAAP